MDGHRAFEESVALTLIVMHHPSLRKSVAALLSSIAGARTVAAADFGQAQELMRCRRPDLVLLDGLLPDGLVFDLLVEAGRLLPRSIRVVLQAQPEQLTGLELAGADLVVLDGAPPTELTTRLERMLTERWRPG